jgi:hypothetical protein
MRNDFMKQNGNFENGNFENSQELKSRSAKFKNLKLFLAMGPKLMPQTAFTHRNSLNTISGDCQ